jgi:hypothetical protein
VNADNPGGGDKHGDNLQRPEQPSASQPGDAATPRPPAETRTMAELAHERHAKSPIQPDKPAVTALSPDGASRRAEYTMPPRPDIASTAPARPLAETRTMADLARERHAKSPIQPDKPTTALPRAADSGIIRTAAPEHRQGEHRLGGRNVITHAHSEFNGKATDLYTDGTRWASGDIVTQATQVKGHQTRPQRPTDLPSGRDQGRNVIGDKPDLSPGDTSDLSPTGEHLAEMENGKHSRLDMLRRRLESEEVLDDLHDAAEDQANTWQEILAARHPQGHAGQITPDSPQITTSAADHATAGDIAGAGLMVGIVLFEAGRRLHDMLGHKEEVK